MLLSSILVPNFSSFNSVLLNEMNFILVLVLVIKTALVPLHNPLWYLTVSAVKSG